VILRSLLFALLLVAVSPAFGPVAVSVSPSATMPYVPPEAYWLQAEPEDADERRLYEAASAKPEEAVAALERVAADGGDTVEALAHLARALVLLDLNRPAEALAELDAEDFEDDTSLADHALFARGLAHERMGAFAAAADAYHAGAAKAPAGPRRCTVLLRAAEIDTLLRRYDQAQHALDVTLETCEGQEPRALAQMMDTQDEKGDRRAAARAADLIHHDYPASAQAAAAAARLKALAAFAPPRAPAERVARGVSRALKLFEADEHRAAITAIRALLAGTPPPADPDLLRARLGRALLAIGREKEGLSELRKVPAGSGAAAEAWYFIARTQARRARRPHAYTAVADRFPGTPWAEEALMDQAHFYQKDAKDAQALPYFRRLVAEYPQGRYADAATWRVAWADLRAGRPADAAVRLETALATRPTSSYTPGFLYWAGRARREAGDEDAARAHFAETIRRYRHAYHGLKAQEAVGGAEEGPPPDAGPPIEEPARTRIRELLLIDRLPEALDETRAVPQTPQAQATRAWILWRQGQLRPAINAMRRAYPAWVGAGGTHLPEPLWRILYPLDFEQDLRAGAERNGLDPALVAALIWQESTFDPSAVSPVGARGLMQIMPRTGRELARGLGLRYRIDMLHEPDRGIEMGTRYLKRMIDGFGGRVDKALAAYNAGPGRVSSWTRQRPGQSAEEFIEGIPFSETRGYVMTVLANREHYRRIYELGAAERASRE
jgi:soluble lytic murein transglycosylase